MIPNIKELRKITQQNAQANLLRLSRFLSIYITWVLLHTRITANQASVLDLMLGILGCCFIFMGGNTNALIGGFGLILFYIFDDVDGEIARYRKSTTLSSFYLEGLCHPIMHPLKFIALGYGLHIQFDSNLLFYLGAYTAILCTLEQASTWRRELIIKSKYNYSRAYSGIIEKWPKKLSIILHIATYVMQEMGMYVVIFVAALLDFILQDQLEIHFSGLNFKVIVLIFYCFSMTLMTAYNIYGSNRMIVEYSKKTKM